MVETVLTALNDAEFLPRLSKPRKSALVCALMALIGLLFVTRGGLHWLELFDTFAVNITLFGCGALECYAIGWVYGIDTFSESVLAMTSRTLPRALLFNLKYAIPPVLFGLAVWPLLSSGSAGYAFPPYGIAIGWCLSLCSVCPLVYCGIRYASCWGGGTKRGALPREHVSAGPLPDAVTEMARPAGPAASAAARPTSHVLVVDGMKSSKV